jgi:NAD(P)-dependent dehydrogenase (short-subunit alcohol dehydrogenase family)
MAQAAPKVWFITGCSTGFGASIVRDLLSRGQKVIATARNVDKLEALKSAGADVMQCDVTEPLDALVSMAEKAHNLHGHIDVLINNAGFNLQGTIEELTPEEIQSQFDTNVFGTINVTKAFLPIFRKQRSGIIAIVSSMGAWRGTPNLGIYESSKWCLSGLAETMRPELADFGIKVVCIEPGSFRSNFLTPGNSQAKDTRIPDYDGTAARKVAEIMAARDGKQPGDVTKGAKVIVDVLSGQYGEDLPLRLPVGKDCYETIKAKCESTLALLEQWKPIITTTDLEE